MRGHKEILGLEDSIFTILKEELRTGTTLSPKEFEDLHVMCWKRQGLKVTNNAFRGVITKVIRAEVDRRKDIRYKTYFRR